MLTKRLPALLFTLPLMTEHSDIDCLLNESDSLVRENQKLKRMVGALMVRVEQSSVERELGYAHFERSIALEEKVRLRTRNMHEALEVLNATNARLDAASREAVKSRTDLASAIEAIQEGFAIFDSQGKLEMKNSRFSQLLPDTQKSIKRGISFEHYVRLSAESRYICLPQGSSIADWITQRMDAHHRNSVNFTLAVDNDNWLQISEQKTSDGGTIVLQTDITDHVLREREERHKLLDEQANIVKATLEHMEQGILIFDPRNRLVEWNEPAVSILKLRRSIASSGTRAMRFRPTFHGGQIFLSASRAENIFTWLVSGPGRLVLRQEVEAHTGAQYEFFGQEMKDGSVVISINEVTRLKQAYSELEQVNQTLELRVSERTKELKAARDAAQIANASKSRFVAAASHDLLQPINAAKLFLGSMARTELNEKQGSLLGRIGKSFQSVETILGSLLDISKLDSGQAALSISEFPLGPLLSRVAEEFHPLADEKGLLLRVVPTSIWVRSDPTYLRRIVQNLVSNAIRYTDTGRILLGVRRRGSNALLSVIDTGIGIPTEEHEVIFREFHRSNPAHSADDAMGLGLAIVERACDTLDHPLSLQSEPGRGSCFSVELRCVESPPICPVQESVFASAAPLIENAIAMVIENDAVVGDAMCRMLEAWGISPMIATGWDQAYEQIESLGMVPDIFLVDFQLDAGENGLDVVARLRKTYGAIIAVLITANRGAEVAKVARNQGVFVRYKPLDVDDLNHLIAGLLSGRNDLCS